MQKRLLFNLNSKGGVGKSLEMEMRADWYKKYNITWKGFDFDDEHKDFSKRHENVSAINISETDNTVDELNKVLKNILESEIPIFNMDCRAQSSQLMTEGMERTEFFSILEKNNVVVTYILFPPKTDSEHNNLSHILDYVFEHVNDFLVVHNKRFVRRPEEWKDTTLYNSLSEKNVQEIKLEIISNTAMKYFAEVEKNSGGISISDVIECEEIPEPCRNEFKYVSKRMLEEYDRVHPILLTEEIMKNFSPKSKPAKERKSRFY